MKRREFIASLLAPAAIRAVPAAAGNHGAMLWNYTVASLRALEAKRQARIASITTPDQIRALQTEVRARLTQMWGPLPEKTPLNPRLVGTLERSGYVIEKIIFESRPRFYVTANLYRPKAPGGRRPALISPPGHAETGKAYESYQRFYILMARQGFVVLTWDPISQGERAQLDDPATTAPRVGPGSVEHRVLGRQCYLLGINLMQYRVWDAIRAIDYLETREDVDPERIGCVGQSGGGMETLQLAPFETRLKAAVPVCAVATFRHKAEAMLMSDPEQVLYGTLGHGIDHPELLSTVAPRALLIGAAIQDSVPIAGARSTYQEVRRVYGVLGVSEKVALVETDDKHNFNRELREAAGRWVARWLGVENGRVGEKPAEITEGAETLEDNSDLGCTATGQVMSSLGGETVYTLNKAYAERISPRRRLPANRAEVDAYRNEIAERVREITRVGPIEKENGIYIPSESFGPSASPRGTVLLVAEAGKDCPNLQPGLIGPLVKAGYRVVGIDVRGWGETAPQMPDKKVGFSWEEFFADRALEMGRPLLGQRLRDFLAAAREIANGDDWTVVGVGAGALLAAHAAVLEPRIHRVVAIRGLLSYRLLLEDPKYQQPFSSFLPGVIGAYEVRDLYAAMAGGGLLVVNPEDARRRAAEPDAARAELGWTRAVFLAAGVGGAFSLRCGVNDTELPELLVNWLAS